MNRPVDDFPSSPAQPRGTKASAATTVLDRVRPTVVVRRRVYDVPASTTRPVVPQPSEDDDDDERGPPSSVNVARALAALRGDELRRLEEIVSADDESTPPPALLGAATAPLADAAPVVPTIRVGPTTSIADLATGMSIPKQDLVTALVTHGFFSMTVKSILSRETARVAAALFGWRVEDDDEVAVAPPRVKLTATAKAKATATKAKGRAVKKPPAKKSTPARRPASKKPAKRRG